MSASYFVLTVRGDCGPYDRDGLRAALQSGEVLGNDQVRNAFGRMLGTVDVVLAGPSSERRTQVQPAVPDPPPARTRSRSGPLVVGALAVLIAIAALLAWPQRPPAAPTQHQASLPAAPADPPRPILAASTAPPAPSLQPATRVETVKPLPATKPPVGPEQGKPRRIFLAEGSFVSGERGFSDPRWHPDKTVDGNPATFWKGSFKMQPPSETRLAVLGLTEKSRQPVTISAYALTLAPDRPARDPAAWRLIALAADGSEREIDSRSGQTWTERKQRRRYALAASATGVAFRLEITEIANQKDKDGVAVQLAEVELLP